MYSLIRAILFLMPPERAHRFALSMYRFISQIPGLSSLVKGLFRPRINHPVELFGLSFKNPVGLAAGFDKNGHHIEDMESLGFGFIEIGSVTALPADGNPQPRLFRLKEDQALINRMGLNNHGADALVKQLSMVKRNVPLFINIAKTHRSDLQGDAAIEDYCTTLKKVAPLADVLVINISCPNSGDGRTFESQDALTALLTQLRTVSPAGATPMLVKVSPDLSEDDLAAVIHVCEQHQIDGFTATNTSVNRSGLTTSESALSNIGPGGLSGAPVHERAVKTVQAIRKLTDKPIVGLGGIRSAEHAQNFIDAGASLVQLYTGFVYGGPGIVRDICNGLKR